MSLHNKTVILLTALALASCGFSPVYKQTTDSRDITELAAVEVSYPKTLIGQAFGTRLTDLLNPTSFRTDPLYIMKVDVERTETALDIQQDRTITRFKIIVKADYTLSRKDTGEILDKSTIKREGGYDKVDSDYATYVSKEDTTKRVTRELAEDAKLRVISAILK